MSEAGQMQEADSGEGFVCWLYYMFVIFMLLPGWCDWDVIARVRLFCEVFARRALRADEGLWLLLSHELLNSISLEHRELHRVLF